MHTFHEIINKLNSFFRLSRGAALRRPCPGLPEGAGWLGLPVGALECKVFQVEGCVWGVCVCVGTTPLRHILGRTLDPKAWGLWGPA